MKRSTSFINAMVLLLFMTVSVAYALPSLHNHDDFHRHEGLSAYEEEACLFALWHTEKQTTAPVVFDFLPLYEATFQFVTLEDAWCLPTLQTNRHSRAPPTLS